MSPLTSLQEMELALPVNPLQESSNYRIELFEQAEVYVLNNRLIIFVVLNACDLLFELFPKV